MLLAIETSGRGGEVALLSRSPHSGSPLSGSTILGTTAVDSELGTSAGLIPAIDRLFAAHSLRPAELESVAVTSGPGSFTGLRVGMVTAKTLAYATGAALFGIPTLHVVAAQCPDNVSAVWAVMDAQRRQWFAGRWTRQADGNWIESVGTAIVDPLELLDQLAPGDWLAGSGLDTIDKKYLANVPVVSREFWNPRAATVGQLAAARFARGQRDDLWQLLPEYHRRPAAEEKADCMPTKNVGMPPLG